MQQLLAHAVRRGEILVHHDQGMERRRAARRQRDTGRQHAARCDGDAGTGVIHDVVVVILGIGGVGGNDDGPDRHYRKIGDSPFRAVFRRYQNTVAGLDAALHQNVRKPSDLIGHMAPADAAPFAVDLADQQVAVTSGVHICKEGGRKVCRLDVVCSGWPVFFCHALPILASGTKAR